jgi:hypothetical protein
MNTFEAIRNIMGRMEGERKVGMMVLSGGRIGHCAVH